MTDDRHIGEADDPAEDPEDAEGVSPPEVVDAPPPEGSEMSVTMVHREGPLPSPADLGAYFAIDDYVGRGIVDMARDAASQRYRMERRSFWVIVIVVLCVTAVLLAVVWGAVKVATEVSVVGGVLVLLASPTAVLWTLLSRLLKRLRHTRRDAAAEE